MIPHSFNPLGRGAGTIFGYVPGSFAFWDGLNNQGVGRHDTSATTWADLSGNGNTLVRQNMNNPIIWASDGGITGDGTAVNRCLINNSAMFERSFTLEVCERKTVNSDTYWYASNRNPVAVKGLNLYIYQSRSPEFVGLAGSAEIVHLQQIVSQKFISAAIVYDGTKTLMYFDGQAVAQQNGVIPDDVLFNTPFCVNGRYDGDAGYSQRYSDSRIYAVRIYHRALAAAELQHNAALDASRFNPTP